MFKPVRWLALALAALVLGWIQVSGIAVAAPTFSTVVYAYGTPGYDQATNHTATERGPPAATNDHTTRSAVEDHLQGTSARPKVAAGYRYTTYDEAVLLAPVARAMGAGPSPVPATGRDLLSLQRWRVAAKGADEAGALVRYDPEFASRNLLGQIGEGYARTPSGYSVSAHAAERIVYGAPGRSPTTLSRVDDILNNPTRTAMRPDGSIRVFQGKDWVAVRDSGQIHIITVMVR